MDGQFADNLPVDRINDVLKLQPGVTADNNGNLSIRGGMTTKRATYVDGVPVQAGYRGDRFAGAAASQISIGTNAFEEASVTTGSSSIRQRQVGRLDRHQDRRHRLRARSRWSPTGRSASIRAQGFNRLEGAFSRPGSPAA